MNAQECACRQAEHANIARELLTALETLLSASVGVIDLDDDKRLAVSCSAAYVAIARARKVL